MARCESHAVLLQFSARFGYTQSTNASRSQPCSRHMLEGRDTRSLSSLASLSPPSASSHSPNSCSLAKRACVATSDASSVSRMR